MVDKLTIFLPDINKEGVEMLEDRWFGATIENEKMVNEADLLMKEKLKHSL